MTTQQYCPFCGAATVIDGRFDSGDTLNIVRFTLDALSMPLLGPAPKTARVGAKAFMCLGCGKVWGEADLKKAREYAELFGSEQLKEKLKEYIIKNS